MSEALPVPPERELDALFASYVEAGQARGLVYGMVTPSALGHARGVGVVDELGRRPSVDTVFPIASMSKSFVAAATLIARDRGYLRLDDPIVEHVPELRFKGPEVEPGVAPTIEMLLGMCGGLTEDNSWVDPFIDLATEDLLATLASGIRLSRPPGTAYEYSNLGYGLVGLALSRVAGRPLGDLVRDELLVPLGLTRTFFDDAVPDEVERAVGFHLDHDGGWVAYPPKSSDAFAAAGGITSTVRDLARWTSWLGAAFRPPGGDDPEVLSRASRRDLQRVRIAIPPALSVERDGSIRVAAGGYALGLVVSSDLRHGTFVSHAGGLPGFRLYMRWHPSSGYGIVVLTNSHRGDPSALADNALGRILLREEVPAARVTLWPETATLREAAERLIRSWDDSLASQILAGNVDFDRPLTERRAEIERSVAEIGPLAAPRPDVEVVSSTSPADVTWSIPATNGELLCMIHLTPVEPARIQEIAVRAFPTSWPRGSRPSDISARRARLGDAIVSPMTNMRVELS